MNRRWTLAAIGTPLLAALLLAGCASPPAGPSAPIKLTILHTNDHHGRFWPNGDGEYGMAARPDHPHRPAQSHPALHASSR